MANNSALKQDIRDYIYTNHNEEITGNILRDVLLEMVDTLGDGWTYKGVATTTTNPGTPDDNVFYIATAPGTYTNFGGLSVVDGEVAILKYNGSWAKDVTGAATAAQVTQLGQKVDEFAQGKFYGYYGDADELPAGDTPGFAYVGLTAPYAIYNFDGENWSDSGLTVNEIPVGNGEDIDFNSDGRLQFADRAYDSEEPNGMGYVILRKSKTFAEQVTKENTIYEIRDAFSLGNATINIPAGCLLVFNGGILSNGTLNGYFKIVAPLAKIFSSMHFTGGCVFNEFFLEWFTDKGTSSVNAISANDASADLNAMFASGIKKVYLTNDKYYYLASSVTIPGSVTINGSPLVIDQASSLSTGISPCFYVSGDTIAFVVDCGDSETDRRSLWMKGIHIFRINPNFDGTDFKENVPAIKLDVHQYLWGVDLEVFYNSELKQVSMVVADGTTKSVQQIGYTGIEIYVRGANNYCTYIRVFGFVRNARRAINIHSELSSNWITDLTLAFDSSCTFGGDVPSATITGKHQTRTYLPDYRERSYFTATGRINLEGGVIWDGGSFNSTTQLGSTYYGLKSINGYASLLPGNMQARTDPRGLAKLPYDYFLPAVNHVSGVANLNLQGNILEDYFHKCFSNMIGDKFADNTQFRNFGLIQDLHYVNASGVDVPITKDNVNNYDKLFKMQFFLNESSTQLAYYNGSLCKANESVKEMSVTIKAIAPLRNAIFGALSNDFLKMYIEIRDSGGNLKYSSEFESSMAYYANYCAAPCPGGIGYTDIVKIRCECKSSSGLFTLNVLPRIFLVNGAGSDAITPSGGMIGGNLRMADAEFFNREQLLAGVKNQCNRIVSNDHLLKAYYCDVARQILHAQVYSLDDRYIYVRLLSKSGPKYVFVDQAAGTFTTDIVGTRLKVYVKYANYKADIVLTYQASERMSIIEVTGSGPTKLLDLGVDLSGYTELNP